MQTAVYVLSGFLFSAEPFLKNSQGNSEMNREVKW